MARKDLIASRLAAKKMKRDNNIKALRKEKNIAQNVLAQKLGISSAYLCDIEMGKRTPADDIYYMVADALGVQYKELFR